MAKGELDYDDLHDFFERSYVVTTQSDTSWLFTSTSERYDGWTVQFVGSGLVGTGAFPQGGTITQVTIKNPEGVIVDQKSGLSLQATDLAAQFEFGDHDDDGQGGDDELSGDDGDDDLSGHGGDDSLSGEDGDDDLHGNGGDDDLHGGAGDDTLNGNGGQDDLFGEDGADVLKGKGGNDHLEGGDDDDVMLGGGGKDVYAFAPEFGDDVIKRFDHGKDTIDLSQIGGIDNFDELAIAVKDGKTIITVPNGGTITIHKISGGKTLDEGDFDFVL
ncbi:MAG TPA: hypothetical protein VFK86_17905 [Bauldia sp.]|nr:hypothetical protein [Bauldia sp.]